jgi:hypothetical protein
MTAPFTKLKISSPVTDIDYHDVTLHTYGTGKISFLEISETIVNQLLQILPEYHRQFFKGTVMRISGPYIKPHTDSYRKVTINFYIKTNNAITFFWKKKQPDIAEIQVAGQTNGYTYDIKDLVTNGAFIAKPLDIWVLDVTEIHSVSTNGTDSERIAYSLSSNYYSYADTLEILGNLI